MIIMGQETNCLFCKFVNGKIKPEIIYEDKEFLAFLDINPMHPGHTLLIPKKHTDHIFDLSEKEYTELFLKAKELSEPIRKAIGTEKIGLFVEGFFIRHAHIHLIPINKGMPIDPKLQNPISPNELKKIGEKIRKEFKQF